MLNFLRIKYTYLMVYFLPIRLWNPLYLLHSYRSILVTPTYNIPYIIFSIINTYKKTCLPQGIARHMTRM